jgi:transposase InsO family protein
MHHAAGGRRIFPPEVATYATKLACELPDEARRSLSLWTCGEIARTLERDEIVDSISASTVCRMLGSSKLKPWRVHHWLSSNVERGEAFRATVEALRDLYTRDLGRYERVFSLDEKTSIQPRPRKAPTKPARPGNQSVQLESEYSRMGALHLLAAFDTRSGEVIGICRRRKRQVEVIELLEEIDGSVPRSVRTIWIVCDNVSTHHGKAVQAWLKAHPRFRMQFTPVHCSWMNQVEQWFSIIQRKRLRVADFDSLADLEQSILDFISEWNERAHPFAWKRSSFDKVLAKVAPGSTTPLAMAA